MSGWFAWAAVGCAGLTAWVTVAAFVGVLLGQSARRRDRQVLEEVSE